MAELRDLEIISSPKRDPLRINDYEFTYSKVRTETRELLGGTEETNILPEGGSCENAKN